MTIGRIDPATAVREGWVRDQDNEVAVDGYNVFIDLDTSDGSGSFEVANSVSGISFSSDSGGDGYIAAQLDVDRLKLRPRTIDPGSPTDGELWHRSDTDVIHVQLDGVTETLQTSANFTDENNILANQVFS